MLKTGDRVRCTGCTSKNYENKSATVKSVCGEFAKLLFDGQQGEISIKLAKLILETPIMTNFKTLVKSAVDTLFLTSALNPKDIAVRKYGVAAEIVRLAEAAKKKYKTELINLGIIQEGTYLTGTTTVFDGQSYILTAETKSAGTRLDEGCLKASLQRRKISAGDIAKILVEARGEMAPATSFKVAQK